MGQEKYIVTRGGSEKSCNIERREKNVSDGATKAVASTRRRRRGGRRRRRRVMPGLLTTSMTASERRRECKRITSGRMRR